MPSLSEAEIKRLMTAHHAELTRWLALDIGKHVDLLNAVAAGQHDNEDDRDRLYDAVTNAHDLVMAMLHTNAINDDSNISDRFWNTDAGRVILNVRLWLDDDEMITLTEAAEILRGGSETRDLVWINDQIRRGKLDRYTDLSEPNPQRAGRVSRAQVEALKDSNQT